MKSVRTTPSWPINICDFCIWFKFQTRILWSKLPPYTMLLAIAKHVPVGRKRSNPTRVRVQRLGLSDLVQVPHLDRFVVGAREQELAREGEATHARVVALERVTAAQSVEVPDLDELVVRRGDQVRVCDDERIYARGVPRKRVVFGARARRQVPTLGPRAAIEYTWCGMPSSDAVLIMEPGLAASSRTPVACKGEAAFDVDVFACPAALGSA
eukprot:5762196-Prymnesium_polylepis.3